MSPFQNDRHERLDTRCVVGAVAGEIERPDAMVSYPSPNHAGGLGGIAVERDQVARLGVPTANTSSRAGPGPRLDLAAESGRQADANARSPSNGATLAEDPRPDGRSRS